MDTVIGWYELLQKGTRWGLEREAATLSKAHTQKSDGDFPDDA